MQYIAIICISIYFSIAALGSLFELINKIREYKNDTIQYRIEQLRLRKELDYIKNEE